MKRLLPIGGMMPTFDADFVLKIAPYLCGALFGSYTLMMSRSRLAAGASFLILSVITLVFAFVYFLCNPQSAQSLTNKSIQIGVTASLINGVAAIFLFYYLANSGKEVVGARLTAMSVTQALTVGVVWPVLAAAGTSPRQLVGAMFGVVAIYLLR